MLGLFIGLLLGFCLGAVASSLATEKERTTELQDIMEEASKIDQIRPIK